jgi:hypothetical protein
VAFTFVGTTLAFSRFYNHYNFNYNEKKENHRQVDGHDARRLESLCSNKRDTIRHARAQSRARPPMADGSKKVGGWVGGYAENERETA